MRIIFALFITLSLAQPALGASWFDKIFGGPDKKVAAIFTEAEKNQIKEYFIQKAKQKVAEKLSGVSTGDDDNGAGAKGKKGGKKGKHGKKKGLPPGLAKKETLPPGLSKHIEKNGTLPPGLAKRNLPDDLEKKLASRSKDHERIIVDNDVVLIEKATGKVLDVLKDVMLGKNEKP